MSVVLLQQLHKSNVNFLIQSVLNTCQNHIQDKLIYYTIIMFIYFQLFKAPRITLIVMKELI